MSHSYQNERRNQKRQQFSHHPARTGLQPKYVIGAVAGVFMILLAYMAFGGGYKSSVTTRLGSSPNGVVRIPLADVSDGRARFYNYRASNGKTVRFFVIKSSDSVYRAAADACDVCYRSRMGYHQEGDDMVCNKCTRHFPSNDVNVITGSCNPDGVPRSIEGSNLLIAAADLDARAVMF